MLARTAGAIWGNSLQVCNLVHLLQLTNHINFISKCNNFNNDAAVGDTTMAVDDDSAYFNVGDIIQFSTTASTEDFDDGDEYRITAIASRT